VIVLDIMLPGMNGNKICREGSRVGRWPQPHPRRPGRADMESVAVRPIDVSVCTCTSNRTAYRPSSSAMVSGCSEIYLASMSMHFLAAAPI
jgi:CheY-like chemotaxis protein